MRVIKIMWYASEYLGIRQSFDNLSQHLKSEQTIYRILDSNDVPRRPKVRGVRKIFVTIEEDVAAILDKEQSVSLYVNEAIRYYHGNRH